eukprot:30920-Pelagococcus_subviridis.AAC.28
MPRSEAAGAPRRSRAHLVELRRELVQEPDDVLRASHVHGEPPEVQEPPRERRPGPVALEPRRRRRVFPAGAVSVPVPPLARLVRGYRAQHRGGHLAHVRHLARWRRRFGGARRRTRARPPRLAL